MRRVALGEPVGVVLAPTPAAEARFRAATAARKARAEEKKGAKRAAAGLPPIEPKPRSQEDGEGGDGGSVGSARSKGSPSRAAPEDDGAEKLHALLRSLQVCSDPRCQVRRAELLAEGAGDGESFAHDHGSVGGEGGGGKGGRRASVPTSSSKSGGGAAAAKANPLLAMQTGFGVEHTQEGGELVGLDKVGAERCKFLNMRCAREAAAA